MEQIRVAIQQARICIVDLTGNNPNVMFELGLAQAAGKETVLLCQDIAQLPFDVRGQRVIKYKGDGVDAQLALRAAIRAVLTGDKLRKAELLFSDGHFRAAILEAAIVLDGGLRRLALNQPGDSPYARARLLSPTNMPLTHVLNHLSTKKTITAEFRDVLLKAVQVRNRAVHEQKEPTKEEASLILSATKEFASCFPDVFEA
jgi:hypothetical protein